MLNQNLLRAKIAENGMTQEEVARRIGMTAKTFSLKIKNGKFGLDEAERMIELLKIDKPQLVFFANEVTSQVTNGAGLN